MKWLLRTVIIAVLVAVCCLMTACGSIYYSTQITEGGARTITLTVNYDEGTTTAQKAQVKQYLEQIVNAHKARGIDCHLVEGADCIVMKEEFASATDYAIAMGYTGDEPNDEATPHVDLNAYFVEYASQLTLADYSTVISHAFAYVSLVDDNILAYWRAYCGGRSAILTDTLQPTYYRLYRSSDLYNDTQSALAGEQGQVLAEVLGDWLASYGYSVRDVAFRYSYEHVYKSVYAKDYSKKYENKETGATVYEWNMTVADIADADIVIYQRAPRVWAWELTAVAAGVAVMGVILVIILIKRRKINHAREAR